MRRIAASLAVLATAIPLLGCGGEDAEPGASKEATLVLDFQPNAVHAGIYAALEEGYLADRGVDLEVRAPSSSTDSLKLLAAGRADLAVMDIHDFGLAAQEGADVVLVDALVGRPLAAVIAGDRHDIRRPRDLEGGTVGVTGLPSDDAVLDAVLEADGADPASVDRVTIGFDSVSALSSGRVEAATAFWNAEGVQLRDLGVPTREFRVDRYGAPRYPELVLVTSRDVLRADRGLVRAVVAAIERGYAAVVEDPALGVAALTETVDGIDQDQVGQQLDALLQARAFADLDDGGTLAKWIDWDIEHGILRRRFILDRRPGFIQARFPERS